MTISRLFRVLVVSGADARAFLQGQLTQDVGRLEQTPGLLAAWCNPKGRVIALMRMLDAGTAGGEIALALPARMIEPVTQRLLMYRLRARVELRDGGDQWSAFAVSAENDIAKLSSLGLAPSGRERPAVRSRGLVALDIGSDVGGGARCIEVYGPVAALRDAGVTLQHVLSDDEWRKVLIDAGIPTIEDATTEKYTPHMLNLDRLGAISFNKGCYTGQEVVARTEHLGSSKRRLMLFRTQQGTAAAGDKIRHGEREVGEVVNAAGDRLLAVVPVELHAEILQVGELRLLPVGSS